MNLVFLREDARASRDGPAYFDSTNAYFDERIRLADQGVPTHIVAAVVTEAERRWDERAFYERHYETGLRPKSMPQGGSRLRGGYIKHPIPEIVFAALDASYDEGLPAPYYNENEAQVYLDAPDEWLIRTYNTYVNRAPSPKNRHVIRLTRAVLMHRQWYQDDDAEWHFSHPQGGSTTAQRGVAAQLREQFVLPSRINKLANQVVHANHNYPFRGSAFDSVENAITELGLTDVARKRNWVGGSNCFKRSRAMA